MTRAQLENAIAKGIAFVITGFAIWLLYAIATGQGLFGLVPW